MIISENSRRNSNFSLNFLNGPHLFFWGGQNAPCLSYAPRMWHNPLPRSLAPRTLCCGWLAMQGEQYKRKAENGKKHSRRGTRGRQGWTKMEGLRFGGPRTNAMLPGRGLNEFGWISYTLFLFGLTGCLCEFKWIFFIYFFVRNI